MTKTLPASPGPTSTPESRGFSPGSRAGSPEGAGWLDAYCPYLRSSDGTWRSVTPHRDQRCWAQTPPAPLEAVTQARLCRTEGHVGCEVFRTAEARKLAALTSDHVPPQRLDSRFGVLVRPLPLMLDEPRRIGIPIPSRRSTRLVAGLALAAGAALIVVLGALPRGNGGPSQPPPVAYVSPSPHGTEPAARTPGASPTPTAPPSRTPQAVTPPPTTQPTARISPAVRSTYRVHKGDTLARIAATFGVTKKQILEVNDLGTPPQLRFGQIINIPAG